MACSNTQKIVLLGKTGAGKSSFANMLLEKEVFTVGNTINSETKKCESKNGSVNGREMTLIDTPGFFDTDLPEEKMKPEIVRCITKCSPGIHAFLLVLQVDKCTEEVKAVISKICQYFSEEVLKYATVLFTRGDQLDKGQTIQDFVRHNEFMSDLVKKCGGRCHVFDNKYWNNISEDEYRSNRFQVKELLKSIDKTVEKNQGGYYTNDLLQAVEEDIRQEEQHIRKTSGNMSEEEIREQATDSIFKKILIRATGIAAGVLLGAFFGGLAVGAVVYQVRNGGPALQDTVTLMTGVKLKALAEGTAKSTVLIRATGLVAVAGAAYGGYIGYKAAEKAETPLEAAKKTVDETIKTAVSVKDQVQDFIQKVKTFNKTNEKSSEHEKKSL